MSTADPLYFFSYSRQELYFAESAVTTLQEAGLNIWFDLQQLEPGSIWADEIQRGLKDCAGVILLASRASLGSPWVALEWLRALDNHKPVYVVLFEAVSFEPIPASEKTNNAPIPLDRLKNEAVAILDARRGFRQNMARLADVVKKGTRVFDRTPPPNRWRIPTVMPLAVAFTALSLVALVVTALWVSLYGFSIYWPMMLGGLAIAAWLGERTLAFLQRRSFREPRALLPIAALFSPLIALWLTPIFALGAVLVNYSPDVERWSPLGQGTDRYRRRGVIPQNETPPRNWLERIAHGYVRLAGRFRWLVLAGAVLGSLSLLVEQQVGWTLVFPLLTVILVVIEIVNRRLRRPVPSGRTYRVMAAPEDARIAAQIHEEMQRAGHKNSDGEDFTILVMSNYTPDEMLKAAEAEDRVICVAASALDDWQRFKPLSRFQFVDYRRQQRARLRAMAFDILNIGDDRIGFSTHVTPQGFDKAILPARVASAIGIMYIGQYVLVASSLRRVFVEGTGVAYVGPSLVLIVGLTLWLMIRATRREIGVRQLLVASVGLGITNTLLAVMFDPLVAWVDPGSLLLVSVVFNSIFYFWLYGLMMRNWLPSRLPRLRFSLRRDLDQWRFHLAVALVSGLFVVTFLGNRYVYATTTPTETTRVVSYEGQITLDVPDYWYPADSADFENTLRRTHDFVLALRRVSSTLGQQGLASLNTALFGDDRVPVMVPVDLVEALAARADFGVTLAHDARYVPDAADGTKTLRFDLWAYPRAFLYADEARALLDVFARLSNNPSPVETTQTGDVTRYEQVYAYLSANPLKPDEPQIPMESRFVIFDTPGTEFFLMFSGDSQTMEAESGAIGRVIESARFEVTPTPSVEVALDNLRFEVPANWQTATTPNVDDPAMQSFFQDTQAYYDQFGVTNRVIWGARVSSLNQPVLISLARIDDASRLQGLISAVARDTLQLDGVTLADDQAGMLRTDDLAARVVQLDVGSGMGIWYVAVIVDEQGYLIEVTSDTTTLKGYAGTLMDWVGTFDTVG
jgi:hypothetical protein